MNIGHCGHKWPLLVTENSFCPCFTYLNASVIRATVAKLLSVMNSAMMDFIWYWFNFLLLRRGCITFLISIDLMSHCKVSRRNADLYQVRSTAQHQSREKLYNEQQFGPHSVPIIPVCLKWFLGLFLLSSSYTATQIYTEFQCACTQPSVHSCDFT